MALPEPFELALGFASLAHVHGWKVSASPARIVALLAEARTLATSPDDEAAALFYAMCRQPRAFAAGWRTMLAVQVSYALGLHGLHLTPDANALAQLRLDILATGLDWPTARARFQQLVVA